MSEYFTGLNYSLANEDNWIEHELAPESADSVLSICGSGGRVIPLLARNPKRLEIADLSREQLWMAELRIAALRQLDYTEYLHFLGYRGGVTRFGLFEQLKLSPECRRFWAQSRDIWAPHGLIYLGKWERHFMLLGKLIRRLAFNDLTPLFSAHTLEEQKRLYDRHWSSVRFYAFLRLALSDFVFNRYLYKGHYAGEEGRRTVTDPAWKMVHRELTRRFTTTLVRKNFFLQMIFLGELRHEEGFPPEAQPEIFRKAREAATDVVFTQGNFLDLTRKRPYDFYSLSDTISYASESDARDFVKNLHPSIKSGTRIVIRSFMRQPHIDVRTPWTRESQLEKDVQHRDCTGLYEFFLLKKS